MKVFISQPNKFKTKEELLKEQSEIIMYVESMCVDERIEWLSYSSGENIHSIEDLGMSLICMSQSDMVVFANEYEEDLLCRMQWIVCKVYGIDTLEMEEVGE